MKLQSLPTFLVRRKNWLLMAALALSLTAALLLRPSSPQAQRVTLPMTSAESSASPLEAFRISRDSAYQRDMARWKPSSAAKTLTALRGKARRKNCKPASRCIRRS